MTGGGPERPSAWQRWVRPALFRLDAETAHHAGLGVLSVLSHVPFAAGLLGGGTQQPFPRLALTFLGFPLASPLGLAAGFDKDARAVPALAALGFSAVEIGTVTPRAQPGNPRPRIFRLGEARCLVNRLGFPSEGAAAVAARLRQLDPSGCLVGVNVGKCAATDPARAADDYAAATRALAGVGHYLAVNVSSPNTTGLRDLQAPTALRAIVLAVVEAERAAAVGARPRPVLVKLAPDLDDADVDAAVEAALEAGATGFIAANTTLGRPPSVQGQAGASEAGGLSGPVLLERAIALVRRIHRRTGGRVPLVGVGGVSSAEDAWRMVRAGATLVQAYTAFIYAGPGWPRQVLRGLAQRVQDAGLAHVGEAVGADAD